MKTLKKYINYLLRCLTLDERRLEARKVCNLGCVRQKSKDWKPISSIPSDPGKYFFANILAPILSDVKAKVKKILLLDLEQKAIFQLGSIQKPRGQQRVGRWSRICHFCPRLLLENVHEG